MERTILRALLSVAAMAGLLGATLVTTPRCQAQAFGGGESERALRTQGVYVPYDGMPLTERYNYSTGSFLYLNQDPRTLYWADYFDRLDRAQKFGYRCPTEPCFPNARGICEPHFGFGLGFYRFR